MSKRRLLLLWSALFYAAVSGLALLLGLRYLLLYSLPHTALGLIYTFAAFVSHFVLVAFLPWLLLVLPLCLLVPRRPVVMPVAVALASLVLTVLLLDSLVFADNRFHLTPLTMSILGWKTWGFGIVYLCILIAFTGFLAATVWRKVGEGRWGLPWVSLSAAVAVLLAFTHCTHIWAEANYYTPVTGLTTYLPFFYPATARHLMARHGWASLEADRAGLAATGNSADLAYPISPLACAPHDSLMNLLVILLDGWRGDALSDTTTPRLAAAAAGGLRFDNHWSGGNSTRMGVFSLFYGLPATYWKYFDSMHRPPLLVQQLHQYGYNLGIFGSAPLYAPANLDGSVFAGVPNLRMTTASPVNATWARDSVVTAQWRQWLAAADSTRPFFGFLFYGNPVDRNPPPGRLPAQRSRSTMYRAALRYTDSLTGVVLRDIDARGLRQHTVVVITADHGEDVDQTKAGFKGHGTAYDKGQLHVPLIVLWPGASPAIVRQRTSHYDIAATLIPELLGCTNPCDDYCSGRSLLRDGQWNWLVVASYYNYAVLQPQQVTIQYPGGYYEVRDTSYQLVRRPAMDRQVLSAAFAETGRFFRR